MSNALRTVLVMLPFAAICFWLTSVVLDDFVDLLGDVIEALRGLVRAAAQGCGRAIAALRARLGVKR